MASLSEKLRRERELRGISLKQISEETKIGVRFLEALEENKLELIPGEFYRRSYLRAYARHLGLDEDRAVNAYLYSRGEDREEAETQAPASDAGAPSWPIWVAGLVLLLGAGFLLTRSNGAANESVPPSAEAPRAEATSLEPGSEPETTDRPRVPSAELVPESALANGASPPPVAAKATDPSAPLRLVLAVTEPCWLEIRADGVVVASGLKEEGFRQALSAHDEVKLWLGNAGGVSLWVNERPAKPLGRDGQVRKNLTITPRNIAEFLPESEDFS